MCHPWQCILVPFLAVAGLCHKLCSIAEPGCFLQRGLEMVACFGEEKSHEVDMFTTWAQNKTNMKAVVALKMDSFSFFVKHRVITSVMFIMFNQGMEVM